MIISNNIPSLRANTQLNRANRRANTSMERLSTGLRINNASDDPAGLSIANRLRREIKGLGAASQNSLDGVSLIQTADGALNEVHAILGRIRELAVNGATDSVTDNDRDAFQREINQLIDEVENIGRTTQFNGRPLFSGVFDQADFGASTSQIHGTINVRIGTGKDNLMAMEIPRLSIFNLGYGSGLMDDSVTPPVQFSLATALHSGHGGSVLTDGQADSGEWLSQVIDLLDHSIGQVSGMRSQMGAYENRLMQTSSVIDGTNISMQTALSRMVDTDMALEMARLTQQNVISQAGISVLAMANQRPQQLLSLLNF